MFSGEGTRAGKIDCRLNMTKIQYRNLSAIIAVSNGKILVYLNFRFVLFKCFMSNRDNFLRCTRAPVGSTRISAVAEITGLTLIPNKYTIFDLNNSILCKRVCSTRISLLPFCIPIYCSSILRTPDEKKKNNVEILYSINKEV